MRQKRDHADRAGKLRNLAKSNDRGTESLADGTLHAPATPARARYHDIHTAQLDAPIY